MCVVGLPAARYVYRLAQGSFIEEWCNGSIRISKICGLGSNPSSSAFKHRDKKGKIALCGNVLLQGYPGNRIILISGGYT